MANALIGSHPSHGYQVVEKIDSNKQLAWGDSGKLFMCHGASTDILVNLPKLSTQMAGWHAKFILATTSNSKDVQINAYGVPIDPSEASGDADSVYYLEISEGGSSKDVDACGAMFRAADDDEIGSMIEFWSDGTRWHMLGMAVHTNNIASVDY